MYSTQSLLKGFGQKGLILGEMSQVQGFGAMAA